MLTIENLSYSIKGKSLINNIDAQFKPGEIAIILGANGAGKTTLTRLLTGEFIPTSGNIKINSKNLKDLNLAEMAKRRGVLSQSNDLIFPLSVHEVIMMGRYPHFQYKPATIDYEICDETMDLFEVAHFKNRNFLTLSGGEKQRVHFARVVAQILSKSNDHLKLLLLDEPLTFLDIRYQISFMDTIKSLSETKNLVVIGVLHDLNLALKYANQIILLKEGSLIAKGEPNDVLTETNIEFAFGIKPEILKGQNDLLRLFF